MASTPKEVPTLHAAAALPSDDRRTRLAYSYLRALAGEARLGCSWLASHSDGRGMEARLDVRERLDPQAPVSEFSFDILLRTTSQTLPIADSKYLFPLEIGRYDLLRAPSPARACFLVLLSLPADLDVSPGYAVEDLLARHSGRWLCLTGAPPSTQATLVTVRLPTWNIVTAAALRELARRVSLGLRFYHEQQ